MGVTDEERVKCWQNTVYDKGEIERGVPLWLNLKGLVTFVPFEMADH